MKNFAAVGIAMFCVVLVGIAHGEPALPAIVATYSLGRAEPSSSGVGLTWELRRGANCVLATDNDSGISERWQRDEAARVWYRKIFPAERKVIEYQPVDLNFGGVEHDWTRVTNVLALSELQDLTQQAQRIRVHGRDALVYRGTRDGNAWEVWWLAAESIPARVQISMPGGTSLLQLTSLDVVEPGSMADTVCDVPGTDGFESIDFADVGDRQADPTIDRLLKAHNTFGHRH